MRLRRRHPNPAERTPKELGHLVARAHYQAWRTDAPPLDLSVDELAAILPNLIKSGSAGLIWPKVEPVRECYGALAFALEAAYSAQVEHNQRVEESIVTISTRLHEAGIAPVLIKGYALSRIYPQGIVRPAGDIDLVVPDPHYLKAQQILADVRLSFHGDSVSRRRYAQTRQAANFNASLVDVDLHSFSKWYGAKDDRFFVSAEIAQVGGVEIRIPSVEHHLRLLCLHLLRHGGIRPLWLCDIALTLETRRADFDWDRCLSLLRRESEYIWVAIALSGEFLGSRVANLAGSDQSGALPAWVGKELLHQWGGSGQSQNAVALTARLLPAHRTQLWPDALSATYRTHRSYYSRAAVVSKALYLPARLANAAARIRLRSSG